MIPKIKRLLSMLLALTMVFSLITPVTASAASTTALHGKKVEIEVGETTKLKVSGLYTKTTWTSSDKSVATVSGNGTVTGIAPGTATITATSRSFFGFFDGGVKKTTFTVVVTGETTVEPTEPEVTEPVVTEPETEALTVKVAETLQLKVKTSGGKVSWESSNKNVATVDSKGLVTGVSEGSVTITATEKKTVGGSWFFWWIGGKTTTTVTEFEVTVLPGDEQPTEPAETEAPTEPPVVTYTVTFNSNGGSEVAAQTVEEGMMATQPADPSMEGYTFVGWYVDEALTEVYDFATAVTADVTLYARWEEEPIRPTMPENPSEADEYFWSTSEVIEVIPINEATEIPTEAEAIELLRTRGFESYPVNYKSTIYGERIEETEALESSVDKHPLYYTFYLSANNEVWLVYIINDVVMANPVSYNLQSDKNVELILSESETVTSYDDISNQFYVNIPYETTLVVKTVGQINAQMLDTLSIEEINEL